MISIQTWRLSIKIANEANSTEHWTKKAKRRKKQKLILKKAFLIDRPNFKPPFKCIFTRIAPRTLDFRDNLPMGFKGITDGFFEWFYPGKAAGRADDTHEIECEFKQERGKVREYGLRIEIIKESHEPNVKKTIQ